MRSLLRTACARAAAAWLLGGAVLLAFGVLCAAGAAPASSPRRGSVRRNPFDGAEMVFVPAGPFLMGDADQDDNPRHTAALSAYWIYTNLVTVGQYKRFCTETGRAMPPAPAFNPGWRGDDYPISGVTWYDAAAYAAWAHAALPTEAQWEKAARGTQGRAYPWGDRFDASKLWCSIGEKRTGTAPVGRCKSGASPYGTLDMAGNLWQWCHDWYSADYWKSDHGPDPQGPVHGTTRVLRGGAFDKQRAAVFRTAFRADTTPTSGDANYGFRCAVPADRFGLR